MTDIPFHSLNYNQVSRQDFLLQSRSGALPMHVWKQKIVTVFMVNIRYIAQCNAKRQCSNNDTDSFTNIAYFWWKLAHWHLKNIILNMSELKPNKRPVKRCAWCSLFLPVQVLFSSPGLQANCIIMFYVAVQVRFTLLCFPRRDFIGRLSDWYAFIYIYICFLLPLKVHFLV